MDRDKKNHALIKWVKDHHGQSDSKFPNGRKWALAAGKNGHAVYEIIESGKASAQMIADLARAAETGDKRYVIDALMAQGLLFPEDLEGLQIELTSEEREHIEDYRLLSPISQNAVRGVAKSLLPSAVDQESPAGEENTPQEA